MAHAQQIEFCNYVRRRFPAYFVEKLVLDVGSLDVNGNNQYLFSDCNYLGVDLGAGPNVDLVTPAHSLNLPDETFDVIVSTECFEHDKHYSNTLKNIVRLLKPGGLFFFSCATAGRPEHGTRRTTLQDAPLLVDLEDWGDYYKNLEEGDIRAIIPIGKTFSDYEFLENHEVHDLYFWGIKAGAYKSRTDYSIQLRLADARELQRLERERHQEAVEFRDKKIVALMSELNELRIAFNTLDLKTKLQASELVSRESVIERLQLERERHQEAVEFRDKKIVALMSELNELRIAFNTLDLKTKLQASELVSRESVIERLQLEMTEAQRLLNASNANVDRLSRKLENIYQSTSWKISMPLRVMGRLVRGQYKQIWRAARNRISKGKRHENAVYTLRQTDQSDSNVHDSVYVTVDSREAALRRTLMYLSNEIQDNKTISHIIALPFLATGGAERVAINLAKVVCEARPSNCVLIVAADRDFVDGKVTLPSNVTLLVLDRYFHNVPTNSQKQMLLEDLVTAIRPHVFHNINSEIAWHLIIARGRELSRVTRIFGSIFAFQFSPDGKTKIGYAASFLKSGLPYLAGLLSDNRRFLRDAITEFNLSSSDSSKLHAIYNPTRVDGAESTALVKKRLAHFVDRNPSRPLQVLWAGRLDEEKRVDLLFEIVKTARSMEFHVFGQTVVNSSIAIPDYPNLKMNGPFESPFELIQRAAYDAFLFTSRWEGLPNILLEIGALGIPIIAPLVGGVGELITEETGYPIPEQPTVSQYLKALDQIRWHPEIAARRAQNLINVVSLRHSWNEFSSKVREIPNYL